MGFILKKPDQISNCVSITSSTKSLNAFPNADYFFGNSNTYTDLTLTSSSISNVPQNYFNVTDLRDNICRKECLEL